MLFIHVITQLIIMKMKIKTKNRSHRYGKIELGLDMDTNIVHKKVAQYNNAYIY